MRHSFCFTLLYLCCSVYFQCQDQSCPYYFQVELPCNAGICLNGSATIVTQRQDPALVVFKVKLQMTLKNIGTQDLLILAEAPIQKSYALFDSAVNAKQGTAIQVDYIGPTGNDSSNPIWKEYRSALDQREPPVDKIRIIKSGESLRFTTDFPILFDRYQIVKGTPRSLEKKAYWDEVKDLPTLFLRVVFEMWDWNLENKGPQSKLKFGHKLQKNWSKKGHLCLEDIISCPVEIQLSKLGD